jgi:hypothetical protein
MKHKRGVHGHKRTGLSVALSGEDDDQICREAGQFWRDLGISELRTQALADVRRRVDSGELLWTSVCIDSLREPWGAAGEGIQLEGQEIQEGLDVDDPLWEDEADGQAPAIDSEDEDHLAVELDEKPPGPDAPIEVIVPQLEGDSAADVEVARAYALRLQVLGKMKSLAESSNLPQLAWHVEKETTKLNKLHNIGSNDKQASAVLRRFLAAQTKKEFHNLEKVRAETRKRKLEESAVKLSEKQSKMAKDEDKKLQLARSKALALLPKKFNSDEFGQGHATGGTKAHATAREQCLDRLRLRAPPLPLNLDEYWPEFKSQYSHWIGEKKKGATGKYFLDTVERVMKELGDHLLPVHPLSKKALAAAAKKVVPLEGDPLALERFIEEARKPLGPKHANYLLV